MREQLIQYVGLLFAGARDCEEIQQEILQNTLDRYDDLIAQGKVPEAAYRLSISGIGDIQEILGVDALQAPAAASPSPSAGASPVLADTSVKKLLRAVAVGLYILCPLPVLILSDLGQDIFGICGLLAIAATATVLMLLGSRKAPPYAFPFSCSRTPAPSTPDAELCKSIIGLIWAIGLVLYFLLSLFSGAWHLTWLLFPITAAVSGIAKALVCQKDTVLARRTIGRLIWVIGLSLYVLLSFATMAWYITWTLFPLAGAIQGLVNAILDYKEVATHETQC